MCRSLLPFAMAPLVAYSGLANAGSLADASFVVTGIDHYLPQLGTTLAVGDLDADGSSDLLVSEFTLHGFHGAAYVVNGPAAGERSVYGATRISGTRGLMSLGYGVAAGDVDGDSLDDAVIVNGCKGPGAGVQLFHGPIESDLVSDDADAYFEWDESKFRAEAIDVVDDADGDGLADLVVGVPGASFPFQRGGDAYVVPAGGAGSADLVDSATYIYTGPDENAWSGQPALGIGDVNGDGIDELAIGSRETLFVIEGGASPGTYALTAAATAEITVPVRNDYFDYGFFYGAAAADYDGDGAQDLIVGVPAAESSDGVDSGVVYAFLGPMSGRVDARDAIVRWESSDSGARLGIAVAAGGDVDADGAADVLMGATYVDDLSGAAYLQLGLASGFVNVDTLIGYTGIEHSDRAGSTVAFVPDWTGDGGSEIAVGAQFGNDRNGVQSGAVYVLFSDDSVP